MIESTSSGSSAAEDAATSKPVTRSSVHGLASTKPSLPSSPRVRIATAPSRPAAVMRNASARVRAPIAARTPESLIPAPTLSHAEACAAQAADVVRQADHEQERDEHEPDDARALHHGVGD